MSAAQPAQAGPGELHLVVAAARLATHFPIEAFRSRIRLETAATDGELRSAIREAEILWSGRVPETVPAEAPKLRWIQAPSAGINDLRDLPVWHSDVVITSSRGIHAVPMAEHLFAMLLALVRHIPEVVRAQEQHEWIHDRPSRQLRFGELRGKTMGILGWGKIGEAVAHLATAFGMRVIGTRWSALVPREMDGRACQPFSDPPWTEPSANLPDVLYPAAQLPAVLAESDVVVVILPLTSRTERSIDDSAFGAMKQGALFFNIGRGPVVDDGALIRALQTGRLAGAGLDVFAQEPLPRSSPLWSMENVIISAHVGGWSERTPEREARFFAVNLERYLDGQPLLNVVDREQEY